MIKLYLIIICFVSTNVFAFNWNKCKRERFRSGVRLIGITEATSSTTEFSTSTGRCAMIGYHQHDKKIFVAKNHKNLKFDIAKGKGEYLYAYALISKCNSEASQKLNLVLRKNYNQIFLINDHSPQKIYQEIENLFFKNKKLSLGCEKS